MLRGWQWVWLCGLLLTPSVYAHDSIREVALAIGEFPPYTSESLQHHGIASQIVTEAFAQVDIEVTFAFFPWPRAYKQTQVMNNIWIGTFPWIWTPQRDDDFVFSDPIIESHDYLYFLDGDQESYPNMEALEGTILGAPIHVSYPLLEQMEAEQRLTIERVGTYEDLFGRLLHRRIEVISLEEHVGRYLMQALLDGEEMTRIAKSRFPTEERRYHLMISKRHPQSRLIVEKFNQGLEQLHRSGRYEEILNTLQLPVPDSGL